MSSGSGLGLSANCTRNGIILLLRVDEMIAIQSVKIVVIEQFLSSYRDFEQLQK